MERAPLHRFWSIISSIRAAGYRLFILPIFVLSTVLTGVILQVTSRGIASDTLLFLGLRQAKIYSLETGFRLGIRTLFVPILALIILCIMLSIQAAMKRGSRRSWLIAGAALLVAVSPLPTASLALSKQGGDYNSSSDLVGQCF